MRKLNKQAVIGYAESFVSFLLPELKDLPVKDIILFGSTARGDYDKSSDIDIFIDLEKEEDAPKVEKIVNSNLKKFYKSRIFEMWGLKGIKSSISVKTGMLEKWGLKRSIISDGIILYGRYRQQPKGMQHYSLLVFEPIKNVTKRNRIIRRLIGRKEKGYAREGLIKAINALPLSQRVLAVPIEQSSKVIEIFSKERVDYTIFEFWTDQFAKKQG
ncbi:nucleotidyltransferase domain-containing protein [Candidatus Woesearchaeota archaeon]|nr:nucleotidyltransferase domain-containing protein [Candidatus Woesearchaeota archaeon]